VIDLSVYSLTAVLKASYKFTGRCFIHLQSVAGGIELRIRPKRVDDDSDDALGEFLNELLDQSLREIVAADTAGIRDLVMAHALSRTSFIRPDLETAEPDQDPRNVSVPDKFRDAAP